MSEYESDITLEVIRDLMQRMVKKFEERDLPSDYTAPLYIPRVLWQQYGDDLKTLYPYQFKFIPTDEP